MCLEKGADQKFSQFQEHRKQAQSLDPSWTLTPSSSPCLPLGHSSLDMHTSHLWGLVKMQILTLLVWVDPISAFLIASRKCCCCWSEDHTLSSKALAGEGSLDHST